MNSSEEKDELISAILKDVHKQIEPQDSWGALRARIDHRIDSNELHSVGATKADREARFWRRVALAMAACLLITAGLLVYMIIVTQGSKGYREIQPVVASEGILSQAQLNQLSTTFAHVRQLFGQHSPWIVVDSGGDSEIGVGERIAPPEDTGKVIIVRLVVNLEKQPTESRYFDVVASSQRRVDFEIRLADASVLDISLKPIFMEDARIAVEISAQADSGSHASDAVTIADDAFTSLVRMRANGNWVNIDAMAQLASNLMSDTL